MVVLAHADFEVVYFQRSVSLSATEIPLTLRLTHSKPASWASDERGGVGKVWSKSRRGRDVEGEAGDMESLSYGSNSDDPTDVGAVLGGTITPPSRSTDRVNK